MSVEKHDLRANYHCGNSLFTSVHDLFGDLQEFTGSLRFFSSFVWTVCAKVHLAVSGIFFQKIAGSSECIEFQTTSFHVIDIEVVV